MSIHTRNKPYMGPVLAVVMDWAGTAVDHGCMGPAAVFVDAFRRHGIEVTTAEAREPMGKQKRDHVGAMFRMRAVAARWRQVHGREASWADEDKVYATVEEMMVETIAKHAKPVPGLLEFVEAARSRGIKIGSCTGYTASMVDVLAPAAARYGYVPDVIVSSTETPAGRPYPWMCYLNAMKLGVHPMESMVKIGDTVADIHEGLNAGMWSVGVVRTGNDVGLSEHAMAGIEEKRLRPMIEAARERLLGAGAHYVVESVADCLPILDSINRRLAKGEMPVGGFWPMLDQAEAGALDGSLAQRAARSRG